MQVLGFKYSSHIFVVVYTTFLNYVPHWCIKLMVSVPHLTQCRVYTRACATREGDLDHRGHDAV